MAPNFCFKHVSFPPVCSAHNNYNRISGVNFGEPFSAKIEQFGWERLNHPPYSPDVVPSDYHLFRSLEHSLRGKRFTEIKEVEDHLTQYFASQTADFYRRGIKLLPEKWQNVIDHNGEYFKS
jgi:hypothetical protein